MRGYADISEKAFTAQVIALLRWHKWRCAHFRPGMTKRGRWVTAQSGNIGFPDLIMCRPPRVIVAELKTSKGKATEEQAIWLDFFKRSNIESYLWRPSMIDDIERILK